MTTVRGELWIPDASNVLKRRGRTDILLTPKPPPDPSSATRFGFWAGTTYPPAGVSSYDNVKTYFGDPLLKGSYRMFHGVTENVPPSFPGSKDDYGPPVVTSFKVPPLEILAGTWDAALTTWFGSMPVNRQIYWSYHHEPENDIKVGDYTPTQYKAAWSRIIDLAPKRPTLLPVCILMSYSLVAGRTISDYVTTNPGLYGLWWDSYLTGNTKTIDGVVTRPKAVSDSFGLTFAICESGISGGFVYSGMTREQTHNAFVPQLIDAAKAANAVVCQWFETDKSLVGEIDWRMVSYPTAVARWRQAVETST